MGNLSAKAKGSSVNPYLIYIFNAWFSRLKEFIFDSSDFFIINKAFGVIDFDIEPTILNNAYIEFKGEKYLILKTRVDFLNIFDDYSTVFLSGKRHSDVYEGRGIPYNIQIIIEAERQYEDGD